MGRGETRRAACCPPGETGKIGTEKDFLVGYGAALQRNTEAARTEERSDV